MATQEKSRYLQIFDNFKAGNPSYKILSDDEFMTVLKESLPFEAMGNLDSRIPVLKRFAEWLDDDFKLASTSGSSLITNINLLPLFDEWSAEYADNFSNSYRPKGVKTLNEARQILLDSYIDTEIVNMNNQNNRAALDATEEERRKMAADRIDSDLVYSPTYRATSQSGVSPITGQSGALESLNTGALEPETFEDFLRLNPNSSVYDLMSMEVVNAGDESFTEGFDSTMFSGWLTNKQKNEANATKEDGTSALWSPSEAIKFIYDLADQGNTKKINELQTMLRRAGYFTLLGEGGVLPIPGVVDTAMEQAWGLFLTDAARMNKTPADMFKQKTNQYAQMTRTGQGMIGKDEAGISQNIDALSFEILGRRLSPAEKQSLVAAVQGWEREQLSTQLYSDKPTTIDIDARLGQLIERENSEEVAFSVSSSMDAKFRKMYGD